MKTIATLAAAAAVLGIAGAARAADFVTIPLETTVNAPAEARPQAAAAARAILKFTDILPESLLSASSLAA